jgi:hypothetical protein
VFGLDVLAPHDLGRAADEFRLPRREVAPVRVLQLL